MAATENRKSDNHDAAADGAFDTAGRFAFDGLERVIHEKARLGILTSLVTHPDGLLFTELRQLCALTDGNLNRHLSVLEETGFIEIWKRTTGRRPQTLVRLTVSGRRRFLEYLELLERIVADAAAAAGDARLASRRLNPGWSAS